MNSTEPTKPSTPIKEKIWDPFVRIAHWTLVASISYLLFYEINFPGHDRVAFLVLAIIVTRILWGFIGTRYARFSAFIFRPSEIVEYTRAAVKFGSAKEYASHNPLGALMVFALLLWVPITILLGAMLFATQQMLGPLEGLIPVHWDQTLEILHYYAAMILLGLIVVHILGVVWASWWHRENYLLAMFTGYKNKLRRRSQRTSAEDRQK